MERKNFMLSSLPMCDVNIQATATTTTTSTTFFMIPIKKLIDDVVLTTLRDNP